MVNHFNQQSDRRYFLKQVIYPCALSFFPLLKSQDFMDPRGVIIRPSKYSVKETMDRLVGFLEQHGVTVYTRINQQSELQKAGIAIPPLEFILFGNPKAGGPIMAENPLVALDLPLKIIAWEDTEKKVWYAFNEAAYLGERYSLPQSLVSVLDLNAVTTKALNG
jgi:uncharacterized protein (DUF302 family)